MHYSRSLAFALLALGACAAPGSAIERQPVSKPLGSYPSAAFILVAADPSATNAAQKLSTCRPPLEAKLNASRVFADLQGEAGQAQAALIIKAALREETPGLLGIEGRRKEVALAVDFIDAQDQSTVASIEVRGTGEGSDSMRVNGVPVSSSDGLVSACQAAADALAEYVSAKK